MEYTNSDQVRIGQWVTMCCERDLFQITEVELPDVREQVEDQLEDGDGIHYEWWEDERSALIEIRRRYRPGRHLDDEAVAEIDRRLEDLQITG